MPITKHVTVRLTPEEATYLSDLLSREMNYLDPNGEKWPVLLDASRKLQDAYMKHLTGRR